MKILCFLLMLLKLSFAEFAVSSLYEIKNHRFVRQNYEESCGAASMANLLNFFSMNFYSEKDILEFLEQKTSMLSFLELKNAALKMNYEAGAFKLEAKDLDALFVPFIVKIENDPRFPHFVVIVNFKGDFLQILDPNFGSYISSKKEFLSVWDKDKKGGYALIILPQNFKDFKSNTLIFPNDFYKDKLNKY